MGQGRTLWRVSFEGARVGWGNGRVHWRGQRPVFSPTAVVAETRNSSFKPHRNFPTKKRPFQKRTRNFSSGSDPAVIATGALVLTATAVHGRQLPHAEHRLGCDVVGHRACGL